MPTNGPYRFETDDEGNTTVWAGSKANGDDLEVLIAELNRLYAELEAEKAGHAVTARTAAEAYNEVLPADEIVAGCESYRWHAACAAVSGHGHNSLKPIRPVAAFREAVRKLREGER